MEGHREKVRVCDVCVCSKKTTCHILVLSTNSLLIKSLLSVLPHDLMIRYLLSGHFWLH